MHRRDTAQDPVAAPGEANATEAVRPDDAMLDIFDDVSGLEVGLVAAALVLTLVVASVFVVVIVRNANRDGHEQDAASPSQRDDG